MEAQTNPAKRSQPPVTAFFNGAVASLIYLVLVDGWKSHPADVKIVQALLLIPANPQSGGKKSENTCISRRFLHAAPFLLSL